MDGKPLLVQLSGFQQNAGASSEPVAAVRHPELFSQRSVLLVDLLRFEQLRPFSHFCPVQGDEGSHANVPPIDIIWTDIPDPHSPLGVRGIGEIGITGAGAAIANSVYNATGVRVRSAR